GVSPTTPVLLSDHPLPVNIGNPDEISIKEFGEEILALVGHPEAHLTYRPLPVDDPKVRRPDISKAREVLDWSPKVDRKEGLKRTYEYFKEAVKPK
ncbi:MAG: SDR family NAD-dependent epimerase/dehydratase, partial [Saprospiraceae bacterium]|nr:SDR family NAD-dependent epimerase/dehydratase [Saprospiraceae bacterium]